ncbi:MAG: oligosaccharide flippase family protein, partial [Flavobacteriales bacterium]
ISKADFGVMSIALVVVGFVEIFAQIGIGPSLVQLKDLQPRHIRAALQFSLGLGVAFFALMYGTAPQIGIWFNSDALMEVLRWVAFSFILSSTALVPRSLLVRHMDFKRLFAAAMVAMVIGNLGIGLGLAYAGYGVWAYVAALLSQNALLGLCFWWMRPPGTEGLWGRWQWTDLREMLAYGGRSTVFNWFNYAATKADTVLVGEFAQANPATGGGWTATGLYDRSAHLMSLPITILGKLGDSVLFSGMSALQTDVQALQRVVSRGIALIAWLVIPGSLALAWFATEVAVLLLGADYADAGPIVRILFIGVAFRSLIKLADAVVRATDQLIPAIAIKVAYLSGLILTIYSTLRSGGGLNGVAWAVTGCTVVQFLVFYTWLGTALQWKRAAAFRATTSGWLGALIAIPGYVAIDWLMPDWVTNGVDQMVLLLKVFVVAIWTACTWIVVALRRPSVVDGGDLELRAQWTAYLPKWIGKHIAK